MVERLFGLSKVDVQRGLTTAQERQDIVRELILKHGLADTVIGRPTGRPVTWAMLFQRAYGVAINPQETLL